MLIAHVTSAISNGNVSTPLLLLIEGTEHVQEGPIKLFGLRIPMGVVGRSYGLLYTKHLQQLFNELVFKVPSQILVYSLG